MAKISRKELKRDRFVQEVGQSVAFVSSHRRHLLLGGGGAVLLVVAALVWTGHRETNRREARTALQKGIEMYHGKVDTEQQLASITFPTTIARFRDTREQFEKVIADHAGGEPEIAAGYYLALLDLEQEKSHDAKTRLEALSNRGDGEYVALVRLALADLYAREEQQEQASRHYKHLIDNPTKLVPKQRSQLAYARLLSETDPETAKTLLEEVRASSGPASAAASALLRELEGS